MRKVETMFWLALLSIGCVYCYQIDLMESEFIVDVYKFFKFDSAMIVVENVDKIHYKAKQNLLKNELHLMFVEQDNKQENKAASF